MTQDSPYPNQPRDDDERQRVKDHFRLMLRKLAARSKRSSDHKPE